jgi:hypothetical protein
VQPHRALRDHDAQAAGALRVARIGGMGKNPDMAISLLRIVLATAVMMLVACAANPRVPTPDDTFYNYAGTLRWNGFEQALDFVDPLHREAQPPTALELERYRQVEVKGYQVVRATPLSADRIQREVEISLVNRHTQRERVLRRTEVWRLDSEARRWWLASGLPDITAD